MEQLVLICFFTFVSQGYLQVINDANYYPVQKDTVNLGPVTNKQYWPVQTYTAFRGDFYGTPQKGTILKACTRQSSTQNVPVDLTTITPQLPARRLFKSENEKFESANIQSDILKDDDDMLTPSNENDNTQVLTSDKDNTPVLEINKKDIVFETKVEQPTFFEDQTKQTVLEASSDEDPIADEPQTVQSKSIKCTNDLQSGRRSLNPPNGILTDSENNPKQYRFFTNMGNTQNQLSAQGGRDSPFYPKAADHGFILNDKPNRVNEIGQNEHLGIALGNKNSLWDPTQGAGISKVTKLNLKSIDSDRVCFACSTVNNPTCLAPDRRTTIKYCRRGVNACVTKIFGTNDLPILIRDCANSCDNSDIPGLVPKYKKCSICHSDLCNGASNIALSLAVLPGLVVMVLKSLCYGK